MPTTLRKFVVCYVLNGEDCMDVFTADSSFGAFDMLFDTMTDHPSRVVIFPN